ncbi:MAG: hypothetical protein V7731_07170 [Amphritea sp.]
MQQEQIQQAAKLLFERRLNNQLTKRLEPQLQPRTADEALAIQQAVNEQVGARVDDTIGGWKCSLPIDDNGLKQLPVVAPIFASTIHNESPCPIRLDDGVCKIEPEIAFRFKHDLPSRSEPYTEQEITAALSGAHLALELIQNRYLATEESDDSDEISYLEHLADCLFNQGLFMGQEIPLSEAFSGSEIEFTLSYLGKKSTSRSTPQTLSGKHPHKYAQIPLYWLVNFLNERSIGMKAGQVVITSSYAGVLEVRLNEEFTLEYVGLGSMTLMFET